MRHKIAYTLDAIGLIGLVITAAIGTWMIAVAPEPRPTSPAAWGGLALIMLVMFGLYLYTKGDTK